MNLFDDTRIEFVSFLSRENLNRNKEDVIKKILERKRKFEKENDFEILSNIMINLTAVFFQH